MSVRVRFAPSPTGSLHVGGARTALFNWLFARHAGGRFVLRIEDTDAARSTRESERSLVEDLRWLGLDWDEGPDFGDGAANGGGPFGPYRQSERLAIYRGAADRLRASGRAYPCFCDEATLEAKRAEMEAKGFSPRYDGTCRGIAAEDAGKRLAAGGTAVLRFRTNEDEAVEIDDLVRGTVSWSGESLGDFVILRSDGMPVYNFAVVVDDAAMRITHVLRAEEHLTNTHRQVLLYRALGEPAPQFAHVSLILAPDRSKLSKRHGATSVGEFRQQGYLPEALRNFLALLGWNPGDDREILPIRELVERFTIERVNRAPAVFDETKLSWMNAEYLRTLPDERIVREVEARIARDGIAVDERKIAAALPLWRPRAKTLVELAEAIRILFVPPASFDDDGLRKHVGGQDGVSRLRELAAWLEAAPGFSAEALEEGCRELAARLGIGLGKLAQPTRLALTGGTASPPIFAVAALLGREESVRRLRALAERIEATVSASPS